MKKMNVEHEFQFYIKFFSIINHIRRMLENRSIQKQNVEHFPLYQLFLFLIKWLIISIIFLSSQTGKI